MKNVYVYQSPGSDELHIQGKTKRVTVKATSVGYSWNGNGDLKAVIMPNGNRHYLAKDCMKIQR